MAEKIRHLIFNEKLATGIDFIAIDHNYAQSKKNLAAPHRAAFHTIIWLKAGDITHHVDFEPVALKADTYLFVQKDAVQLFDHNHTFSSEVLIFTDTFFCRTNNDYQFLKTTPLFNHLMSGPGATAIKAMPALKLLWQVMTAEFQHISDAYRQELLKNYLHSFLLLAERELNRLQPTYTALDIHLEQVLQFRELLETNFRRHEQVSFYADKLSVTGKVLTNALQRVTGKSPKQLADERLLLEAKRMLIYSNTSGKVIGFSLGFDEPTNFIKFFKNHTGITPAAFRKKYVV